MELRRVVVLVVALALAAIAALASYVYLKGTQDRANQGAVLVPVLKVRKVIPKGLPGERAITESYVVADRVPAKFRPDNAVLHAEALRGKVALVPLAANLVVIDGLFVDPQVAQVTNSERIPPGHVAVSVAIEGVRGVAGLIVPGDFVNIMASRRDFFVERVTPDQARRGHTTGPREVLAVLYQKVEILFIGNVAAPQPGEAQTPPSGTPPAPSTNGIITFSVPQEAAERIVLAAQSEGGLYLTLVPPSYQPVPVPPVGQHNLFGPPCENLGGDNHAGTVDDVPVGCVPLTPSAPTTAAPAQAG